MEMREKACSLVFHLGPDNKTSIWNVVNTTQGVQVFRVPELNRDRSESKKVQNRKTIVLGWSETMHLTVWQQFQVS